MMTMKSRLSKLLIFNKNKIIILLCITWNNMHTKAYILIPFKLLWGMIIQVFGALMSNTIIHRQIILSETQNMLPETKSINAIFGFFMVLYTLKKSYKRPPHIFSSSSESKIRSIKIHDHMNKPMSNSGSVSFCIPKCVILLTQTKHV